MSVTTSCTCSAWKDPNGEHRRSCPMWGMTAPRPESGGQQQAAAEGRCSADQCWYTLPLVDGLIVAHSKAGTLNVCEGGGRPPRQPLTALEWLRVTHADTLSGRRIEEAVAEAARPGQELRERVDRWIREAVIALEAATVISERMHRTGVVEGLHLGNHDRLVREAAELRAALEDPR